MTLNATGLHCMGRNGSDVGLLGSSEDVNLTPGLCEDDRLNWCSRRSQSLRCLAIPFRQYRN